MENELLQRIRQLIGQLKSDRVIASQRDFAQRMGYKSAAAFSQIITGHTRLPRKFIDRFCANCPSANRTWIEKGEGEMLNPLPPVSTVTLSGNSAITKKRFSNHRPKATICW